MIFFKLNLIEWALNAAFGGVLRIKLK